MCQHRGSRVSKTRGRGHEKTCKPTRGFGILVRITLSRSKPSKGMTLILRLVARRIRIENGNVRATENVNPAYHQLSSAHISSSTTRFLDKGNGRMVLRTVAVTADDVTRLALLSYYSTVIAPCTNTRGRSTVYAPWRQSNWGRKAYSMSASRADRGYSRGAIVLCTSVRHIFDGTMLAQNNPIWRCPCREAPK